MSGNLSPKYFDDEITVITLLGSENTLKLWPSVSLIRMRVSEMAMASRVNVEAICDVL
jgi:hypothetical protein